MKNDDKYKLLHGMVDYWQAKYPDAFIEHPGGKRVFREELVDYFQDQKLDWIIQALNDVKAPVVADATPIKNEFRKDVMAVRSYADMVLTRVNEVERDTKAAFKQQSEAIKKSAIREVSAPFDPFLVYTFSFLWPLIVVAAYWSLT